MAFVVVKYDGRSHITRGTRTLGCVDKGAEIPYQRFRGTYLVPRRMSERANRMGKQYELSGTSWYELVQVGTSWYELVPR